MSVEEAQGVAAAGDEVARLYEEYGAKLQRFCMSRLRSHEEAEDAVQSTFLRVYTALRKGAVPQYEAAWLYKIAHNVCLSRIESTGRRARHETATDLDLLGAEMAAPASRRDELIGLESALAEMPANMRQAILLREWQGLSYQEIAEALGVSVSAVESMIFRGRRFLANALEPSKRAAGAINVGWLLQPIRAFFSGAGAATKIAAGAALVAAGAGGVGVGLSVGASSHHPPPAPTAVPLAATAPASSSAGTGSASVAKAIAVASHATTAAAHGGRAATGPRVAPVSANPTTPHTTPAATTGETPTTPTVDSRPGTAPTTTPQKPPTTTATLPIHTPTLPPVTVPSATVTVPGVTTITTPTVPPVTTPTLPTPTVTVPGVTTVTVPTVTLP
jgi:RNA polymerase sigma factor (sigma-70 family)